MERFSRAKPFQLSFSKKVLCINAFAHIPTQTSSLQHPFCKVPTIAPFSSQTSTQTSIHSQRKRKASLNVKRKLFFEALFLPFDIVIATGLSFETYDWARSSFANHRVVSRHEMLFWLISMALKLFPVLRHFFLTAKEVPHL